MVAAGRHDNENIDDLLYKKNYFYKVDIPSCEVLEIVRYKFQQIKIMRNIFIVLRSSNQYVYKQSETNHIRECCLQDR